MQEEIRALLKEKNGIMLAHNYQRPEVQDVADLCGDSLELSIKAAATKAAVILFCGVHFMAETASILSPNKKVLLPRIDAGCPMADMIDAESLKTMKTKLGPVPVVTYVNSTAEVKALSTICCTSANVLKVVDSIEADEILMTPDKNLAQYAAAHSDKKIHFWQGYCPTHEKLTAADVKKAKASHPQAVFMAHPECRPEVLELADVIVSTSGMLRHAGQAKEREFIVGTESGLLHPLKKANPDKRFFAAAEKMVCPNMKKITLEDVLKTLETMEGEVKVPEETRLPALEAVQKMVDLA